MGAPMVVTHEVLVQFRVNGLIFTFFFFACDVFLGFFLKKKETIKTILLQHMSVFLFTT